MLKKIIAYLPSTVIPIFINFILVFIYAGQMEPVEYGIYNVYLNSISIIYAIALSFLQSSAFRFYSVKGLFNNIKEYYSTYYFSNIIICILIAIVLLLINFIFEFDWIVVSTAIALNAFYQFDINMYRLRDKTGGYAFSRLTASFGALGLIVVCIALINPITYKVPIYTFYGAYVLTIIVEFIRCFKSISFKSISKKLFMASVRFGMPMMGVTVMGLLMSYTAQYIILFYLSEVSVGYYSLGFRLSDTVISNITMIILTVMTPIVMKLYDDVESDNVENSSLMLTKLISLDMWVILPCCALLAFYSGDIIRLLFPSYEGAEPIVVIIVFSAILRSLSMITCKGLELARKTGKMFLFLVISLAVNIIYMFIFIPIYGIEAAGHASIIAYLIYNIFLIKESYKYIPIKIDYHYLIKVMIMSAITVVLALLLSSFIGTGGLALTVVQGSACVLVYFFGSLLLGLHRPFTGFLA